MISLLRTPRGEEHELELVIKMPTLAALRQREAQLRARGWVDEEAVTVDAFYGSGRNECRLSAPLDSILAAPPSLPSEYAECIRKKRVGVASVRSARMRLSLEKPTDFPDDDAEPPQLLRRKLRRSFRSPDAPGWLVESTLVMAHAPGDEEGAVAVSYELEVEVPLGVRGTKEHADELRRLVDALS